MEIKAALTEQITAGKQSLGAILKSHINSLKQKIHMKKQHFQGQSLKSQSG